MHHTHTLSDKNDDNNQKVHHHCPTMIVTTNEIIDLFVPIGKKTLQTHTHATVKKKMNYFDRFNRKIHHHTLSSFLLLVDNNGNNKKL